VCRQLTIDRLLQAFLRVIGGAFKIKGNYLNREITAMARLSLLTMTMLNQDMVFSRKVRCPMLGTQAMLTRPSNL
jgi:hypothetical protein